MTELVDLIEDSVGTPILLTRALKAVLAVRQHRGDYDATMYRGDVEEAIRSALAVS